MTASSITRNLIKRHIPKHLYILFTSIAFLPACSNPSMTDEEEPKPQLPEVVTYKTYYLSKNGNDANAGTKENPWQTLERLNAVDLEPGETVYLEGGTTFPGTLMLDSLDSGTAEKPIIITSYGNGPAVLDGGTSQAAVIKSSFFSLKGINAKGAGRKEGNTSNGIELVRASNGTIEQVIIEGFQHAGLKLESCKNVEAVKVVARNNGYSGIYVTSPFIQHEGRYTFPNNERERSRNITLKDCVAENNPGDPSILNNHSGSGIFIEYTKKVMVDHCTATNNGWDMPRGGNGPVGIWTHSSDSVTMQYCISYRNKTSAKGHDGGGFVLDGGVTNSVIQYCLSYENEGAGYGLYQWKGAMDWNNNIVRYSISINDAINGNKSTIRYAGYSFWNNTSDKKQFNNLQVYNNVVFNTISPAIFFKNPSSNANFGFYNNIFVGKDEIIVGHSTGEKFLGNTYWNAAGSTATFRGHKTLQDWANSTGQEMLEGKLVGMVTDPMFSGPLTTNLTDPHQLGQLIGFKLQPNSTLKDKGLNLLTLFNIKSAPQDFYGNIIKGGAPEPGVHELD